MFRTLISSAAALLLAISAAVLVSSGPAAAQETAITILVRDFACDTATPENVWDDCEAIWDITYTVEADGTETPQSPVTTVRDMGIGHGIGAEVPNDATSVSITPTGGIPEGYEPADGYNPFSAAIADLPDVGFGGESTGPGINMMYVPSTTPEPTTDDGTDDSDQDEDPTTLPNTGTGGTSVDSDTSITMSLLAGSLMLASAGLWIRRDHARR